MSSDGTAYSPSADFKSKDWANHPQHDGQYASGPGLRDPDDPIQNPNKVHEIHMDKQERIDEPGPTSQGASNDRPRYEHFEHSEHARSPTLSAQPALHLHNFHTATTAHSSHSTKPQEHVERHETVSTIRKKIGLAPEAPISEGHDSHEHLRWSSVRTILREPFAEFFGTFVMVLFGNGSVAQVLLSTGSTSAPGGMGFGAYQSISWG